MAIMTTEPAKHTNHETGALVKSFLGLIFILAFSVLLQAQDDENKTNENPLIQFSGVIVSADSLHPIPFSHIYIKHSRRGTISDFLGFFSLVAEKGDIIVFSSLGYKTHEFKIPDTLSGERYSMIQAMNRDTIWLATTVIYPWPTPTQFKKAFVEMNPPADDYDRALKNLALAELKERAEYTPMDGSMNFRNLMNTQYGKMYYSGQLPPNNLLNPLAWASFIKAWKEGAFKQKKQEPEYYYDEPLHE